MSKHSLGQAVLSAVLVLAAAQGCGDDSSDNPTPPDVTTGGSNATAGNTSKAGSTGEGGSSTAGNAGTTDGGLGNEGGTSASVGGGNEGGSGEPPLPACELPELGANGCFNCPEDGEVEQWLNRCVDGDCEPFDNKTRVPLLNADGSLPDLPN